MIEALMRALRPALRKRAVVALILGGVMFSSVYAFAATLGVNSTQLAAGSASVTSCVATNVNASYLIAYDQNIAAGGYRVDKVVMAGLAGCAGKSITADLTGPGASTASLKQVTYGPISAAEATAGSVTITVPYNYPTVPGVPASSVTGISIAIAG